MSAGSKPITACAEEKCDHCSVREGLTCHFRAGHLFRFYAMVLPSFILAAAGLLQSSQFAQLIWVAILVLFFIFVEIRVLCSHCPHYAEASPMLLCWANYGIPKLWKYRPGLMSLIEKIIFFTGLISVWGFPFLIMALEKLWLLLFFYSLATAMFFILLGIIQCRHCIHLACPLNQVSGSIKNKLRTKLIA